MAPDAAVADTHSRSSMIDRILNDVLDGQKADEVILARDVYDTYVNRPASPSKPAVLLAIGGNRKGGGSESFSHGDMGQVLSCGSAYATAMCADGVRRLLLFLMNTEKMRLWELQVTAAQNVHYFDFGELTLEVGLAALKKALTLPTLFSLSGHPASYIGRGATSVTFKVTDGAGNPTGQVAKVIIHEAAAGVLIKVSDHEREVLTALRNLRDEAVTHHTIRLVDHDPLNAMTPLHRATLVMEPFATPLTPEALLAHPQFAADLVRALRGAHTAGIIHCDVRFENVYVHAGGVIIADWGFAYRLAPDAQPRPAIGTVATAAEEVLIAYLGDRLLTPKKAARPTKLCSDGRARARGRPSVGVIPARSAATRIHCPRQLLALAACLPAVGACRKAGH